MKFRREVTIAAGLIVASGVAAAAFAMMFGSIRFFTPTFVIVVVIAVCLGLPIYLAARAARNDTPIVAAVMGFIVGIAVPAILVLAGPSADQASVGDTATVVDGSYTSAGWLQNLGFVCLFGLVGIGAALVFWSLVRQGASSDEQDADTPPPTLRTAVLLATAVGMIASAFVIPYATADRTCHNPLRDGRDSIGPVASFGLRVGVEEWRNVEAEMEKFQHSGNWSVRSDIRTDESFPWLQISLCKEPGTNISVDGIADFNEVNFSVFQPQGGSMWRRDFRALYERISARWPTKIEFKNGQGEQTTAPDWATAGNLSRKR